MRTDNYGFTLISTLQDLLRSYNGDLTVIDTILGILGSPNDGSSLTVDEPTAEPELEENAGAGDLSPGLEYFYTYTFLDPATGLESAGSPENSIVLSDEMASPAAPTFAVATSGGGITPGTYSYVLSKYVAFNTTETSAVNAGSVILHQAGGNDQEITLTLPALDGATGFNVYRMRPGSSSYYYIGSTTGSTFVDDGLGVEDCERFAPVYSNLLSSYSVLVAIGGATPYLPVGYHWKIYRSTESAEYADTLIATVTDGSLTFLDVGYATGYGTPPTTTPILVPGNVGLRSGAGAPTTPDGNDGDWWIDTDTDTLYGPKSTTWPTPGIALGGGTGGGFELHTSPTGTHGPLTVGVSGAGSQTADTPQVAIWWPCYVSVESTITCHQKVWTGEAGSTLRFSLWTFDPATCKPGTLIEDLGTVPGTSTGVVSATESTQTVSGWFYIGVWASNNGTVRWNKSGSDEFGTHVLGTVTPIDGATIRGWRATGEDYSSAWSATLPTLSESIQSTHHDDPLANFTINPV